MYRFIYGLLILVHRYVYVCVCVCVCVCIYICVCVCIYIHMRMYVYIYMYIYTHIYVYPYAITIPLFSFVVDFEIRKCELSNFILFKLILAILDPLHFHMNFSISLFVYAKKGSWNFDKDCIDSRLIWGSIPS